MLPEEKAFRKWYRVAYTDEVPAIRRDFKRLCTDLIRAAEEAAARAAEWAAEAAVRAFVQKK